jgi:transaldolase
MLKGQGRSRRNRRSGGARTSQPVDCTTTPTIVLKALGTEAFRDVVQEALSWGKRGSGDPERIAAAIADPLGISVGIEPLRLVQGCVSTEVDANPSFNIAASIHRGRRIIAEYRQRGVERDRVLTRLTSTWEGIRAAEVLQREFIMCNMMLLLNRAQAVASAEAGAFLVSSSVGRIYDWHKKASEKDLTAAEDPSVRSVRNIYNYYKANCTQTIVMGASFRSTGQIEALAGYDRLTIAPALLDQLANDEGNLERALGPGDAILREFVSEDAINIKHYLGDPMGEITFRWAMNEESMATEKLAEGIRDFARDLRALRDTPYATVFAEVLS